jgi:hypothetical protein
MTNTLQTYIPVIIALVHVGLAAFDEQDACRNMAIGGRNMQRAGPKLAFRDRDVRLPLDQELENLVVTC